MTFTVKPDQRVRHLKRGSVYHTLMIAELQVSTRPPVEGDKLVIYKAPDINPKIWAREKSEFEDGRFQLWGQIQDDPLAANPAARDAALVGECEELLGALLSGLATTAQIWHVFSRCQNAENDRARRIVEEARAKD